MLYHEKGYLKKTRDANELKIDSNNHNEDSIINLACNTYFLGFDYRSIPFHFQCLLVNVNK